MGEVDKLPGIHSEEQFAVWLEVYNRNADNMESMTTEDSTLLAQYGVYNNEETLDPGWTFLFVERYRLQGYEARCKRSAYQGFAGGGDV